MMVIAVSMVRDASALLMFASLETRLIKSPLFMNLQNDKWESNFQHLAMIRGEGKVTLVT